MNWKQFLTEKVLKKHWARDRVCPACYAHHQSFFPVVKDECTCSHHTYDNRNDLLDLYEAIYRDGKWDDFFWDFAFQRKPEDYGLGASETTTWLFCLDGKGYEDRCKMVAEFYGWEEQV